MKKKQNYLDRSRIKRDKFFSPIIFRLPKWVTPNLLCYLRFILGFVMACLVYYRVSHFLLVCFFLWLLGKFIDCLDGGLARLKNQVTWNGKILDGFSDRFVLLMLVYAAFIAFPLAWILPWAMLFIMFMFLTDVIRLIIHKFYKESSQVDFFWQILEIISRAVFSAIFLGQYLYFY